MFDNRLRSLIAVLPEPMDRSILMISYCHIAYRYGILAYPTAACISLVLAFLYGITPVVTVRPESKEEWR